MKCIARVYDGQDNYIFVGFAPEDCYSVFPILERLDIEGFRIWYQSTEEITTAAERLKNSTACVFVMSKTASETHSVVNKLSYAISISRPTALFFLDSFPMTPGLMMQQGLTANYSCDDPAFYERIISENRFQACRESARSAGNSALSEWRTRAEEFSRLKPPKPGPRPEPPVPPRPPKPTPTPKPAPVPTPAPVPEPPKPSPTPELPEPPKPPKPDLRPEPPEPPKPPKADAVIVRVNTGEVFKIASDSDSVIIGRKGTRGSKADIDLTGTKAVTHEHAKIIRENGEYFLQDIDSRYGTFIGEKRLEGDEKEPLHNGTLFRLTNEDIRFVTGKLALDLLNMNRDEVLEWLAAGAPLAENEESEEDDRTVYSPPASQNVVKEQTSERNTTSGEDGQFRGDEAVRKSGETGQDSDSPVETEEELYQEEDYEKTVRADLIDEMTVRAPMRPVIPDEDPEKTVRQKVLPAAVLRLTTGELFPLKQIETVLGRTSTRRKADIMFSGNEEISREHAAIYQYNGKYLIRDCGSVYGTFINGKKLESEETMEITDGTIFCLSEEPFLFITGKTLKKIRDIGKIGFLRSRETGEQRIISLSDGSFRLDRNHPWNDGILAKGTISKNHAEIFSEGGAFFLRDIGSTNGTSLNGDPLEIDGEAKELHSGDKIEIYDVPFIFSETQIDKENKQ